MGIATTTTKNKHGENLRLLRDEHLINPVCSRTCLLSRPRNNGIPIKQQ
jgi:hypothetical protein